MCVRERFEGVYSVKCRVHTFISLYLTDAKCRIQSNTLYVTGVYSVFDISLYVFRCTCCLLSPMRKCR